VELDLVDAVAVAVVRAQDGRVLVCQAAPLDRFAPGDLTDRADLLLGPARALPVQGLDQRAVLREDVVGLQRGNLVQHLVGGTGAGVPGLGDGHARSTLPLPSAYL
jgi:hypothetical protein